MLTRNIDKFHLGGEGEITGVRALGSRSSFIAVLPKPPVIEYANTSEGFPPTCGTGEASPTSGDSIQSSDDPSSPHPQQSLSSEQLGPIEVYDRSKNAVGPLRKFQPFSFARAGLSKTNSLGQFKESSHVAEQVALGSQPESTSKSTTKSQPQSTPLSVKSSSVFANTYLPIRPSRFNRTGLFSPENQHPALKRSEK